MNNKIFQNIRHKGQVFFFIFFVLVSCSITGQVKQKRELTVADYGLWSTLQTSALSSKGLWVSYLLQYESGLDTLFVSSHNGKHLFSYPKGSNGKFGGERWFACMGAKNRLDLTALSTGKRETLEGVIDFEFSKNDTYLVAIGKKSNTLKTITIRNLINGKTEKIEDAISWRFNDDRTMLAYCVQQHDGSEFTIVSLGNELNYEVHLDFPLVTADNLVWDTHGRSLVFVLRSETSTKLALYRYTERQLYVLDPEKIDGFPKGKHIHSNFSNDLCISEDGKRVLFQVVSDSLLQHSASPTVQIWNGTDKRVYSERQVTGPLEDWAKTAVWYPDSNAVFAFMPQETHVLLSGNQEFALSSNLESCEPQLKYIANIDYYLTNLITHERTLWLACHSGALQHTFMSPAGDCIVYFSEGHWFSYNTTTGKSINLTGGFTVAFYDEANDIPDQPDAYGFVGWTKNDSSILIYDQFDLWEVATDGTHAKRLTHGREKGICFRMADGTSGSGSRNFLSVAEPEVIDLKAGIVLKATTPTSEQFGYYTFVGGIAKPIVFGSRRISFFLKASQAEVYAYLEEDYEHPPRLKIQRGKNERATVIYQSNLQQMDYYWGKSTVISYVTKQGVKLNGLLYYPADYKSGETYPMVVHIYEKQMDNNKKYINPSVYLTDGFNVTHFTTQGYFVLLPDIHYSIGSPGDSALDCVSSAVTAVIGLGIVNPNKIGLLGHSFGGYETSFILTKSQLFATAVAGAPQTNCVSSYLDISANYKKPEFWRYESYSNRMGKPLFDDLDNYIYNSPIFHANTIATPLLIWTGDNDTQVRPSQSMELYLALRRLGKKVILLCYPNEDHALATAKKQADLTQKVSDWFDYYLKDKPLKSWMEANANP